MGGIQLLASFDSFTLTWHYFFGQLVAGLTLGSLYALLALGYSMVYGILKLLNFAHGDVYMIGAFLGFFALHGLGGPVSPSIASWLVVALMFLASMLGCGVLGVVIERFAYRPLRNAPRIAPLISALGIVFFLESSVQLITNSAHFQYGSYSVFAPLFQPAVFSVGSGPINVVEILIVGMALALMVALLYLVNR